MTSRMRWSRDGAKVVQTWASEWRGHQIVLKNWLNLYLIGTGEEVYVDGQLVFSNRSKLSAITETRFYLSLGAEGSVSARLECGVVWPFGRPGLKLYFNDELVCGDIRRFKRWWEMCLFCGLVLAAIAIATILFIRHINQPRPSQRAEIEWTKNEAILRPPLCERSKGIRLRFTRDSTDKNRVSHFFVETETGEILQELSDAAKLLTWSNLIERYALFITDYDFDGCKDLAVIPDRLLSSGAFKAHVWLYRPAIRKFEYSSELSAIPSVVPDHNRKLVRGSATWSGGSELDIQYYSIDPQGRVTLKEHLEQRVVESGDRMVHRRNVFEINTEGTKKAICDMEFSRVNPHYVLGDPISCLTEDFPLPR